MAEPFTTQDAIEWFRGLTNLLVDVPVVVGPYVPDSPDRVVVVTNTPGPGFAHDGVADDQAYQVRVRGRASSPTDAEVLAKGVDWVVLRDGGSPRDVGTKRVLTGFRLGSGPAPLSSTPDNGDRTELVTTYVLRVATDI